MTGKQDLHTLLNPGPAGNSPTFIIYSEQVTKRLDFTCRFIFNHVLKINYVLTSGKNEFNSSSFYKINYSQELIDNAFHCVPGGLLSQSSITNEKPGIKIKNGLIYFYETKEGDLHFDVFSAVFFMVSRYEEWQQFTPDKHGRFERDQSVLFRSNFHNRPVVDLWILELRKELALFNKEIIFPRVSFQTIATIDVDNLFAYSHKGFIRTIGASLKDVAKGDLKNLKRRLSVVLGKEKDPFDIYESFSEFCSKNKIPLIYFFLFKSGTQYDRTVNPLSPAFIRIFNLVRQKRALIGLHPSYHSSDSESILAAEVKDFAASSGNSVLLSRQHYLRFNIKTTPRQLLKNGILADFSMGFASGAGFRAGTAYPFYYYDFTSEQESELLLVPFCAMDGAYFIYDKASPEHALQSLQELKAEVKKTGGLFVTVFHERTFDNKLYSGFSKIYKLLLLND